VIAALDPIRFSADNDWRRLHVQRQRARWPVPYGPFGSTVRSLR
jgi:hypothetical protein